MVRFPRPVSALCHPCVLVETFERGIPIDDFSAATHPVELCKNIAQMTMDCYLKMMIIDNFTHVSSLEGLPEELKKYGEGWLESHPLKDFITARFLRYRRKLIRQMHVDELVRVTNLTISSVAATLTVLEMKGIVKDYGEKTYGLK